ncbi:hypothetical protein CsSME_00048232 [Camellia sinensis var. sinensis]
MGQQSAIDDMNQSDANAGYIMGLEHKFFVKESNTSPCDSNQAALAISESTQTGLVSKCQLPGLDYVLFVKGFEPHNISYAHAQDKPPKEIIVSHKCAKAVLRGVSAHVEKGDAVAVSVAVEQPGQDGGWGVDHAFYMIFMKWPTLSSNPHGHIRKLGVHLAMIKAQERECIFCCIQASFGYNLTREWRRPELEISKEQDPYFSERSGLYIGQGTTMMSRAGMFRVLQGIDVDMNNRVFELPSFHVYNSSFMLAVYKVLIVLNLWFLELFGFQMFWKGKY